MTEFEGLMIDNLKRLNSNLTNISDRLDEIAANSNYIQDISGGIEAVVKELESLNHAAGQIGNRL